MPNVLAGQHNAEVQRRIQNDGYKMELSGKDGEESEYLKAGLLLGKRYECDDNILQ
jgi:hypothetical protein